MNNSLLAAIDAEIARLKQAKTLLGGGSVKGNGRTIRAQATRTERVLSVEARARIAAAQKKRWAKAKKRAA